MVNIVNSINLNVTHALANEDNYFTIKKYTFNNNEYKIIRYNKAKLKELNIISDYNKYNTISKFRSVIIRNNKVVCFAPEKSVDYSYFVNKYSTESSWLEDYIDGTMINVFYDTIKETWEIATRSSVGANIVFFNDVKNYKYFDNNNYFKDYYNLTFRSMFFEACNSNNFDLNCLDKKYVYSFVLQHPFNRIVTTISAPAIYLVKIYEITHPINNVLSVDNLNHVIVHEIDIQSLINVPPYIFLNSTVKLAAKYPVSNFQEIKDFYESNNASYHCVGCFLYSKDGSRSKIRNVSYEEVRKLRGNQPKLQFNYLTLKQQNKVKEFLQYYPEHTLIFNKFKLTLYYYTSNLFMNYVSCFIRKEKPLKEYDFEYKTHMYKLHEKYKNELKQEKKIVDKKFVISYVNSLPPSQQMFLCNFKNHKTQVTSDTSSLGNGCVDTSVTSMNVCPSSQMTSASLNYEEEAEGEEGEEGEEGKEEVDVMVY
jgi:hypothetical protein|uniref:Uncharacterized protein n=1 Tax=viral metagenome TaxID=1070528 RepID=A0A6C0CE93_9ZZZZ